VIFACRGLSAQNVHGHLNSWDNLDEKYMRLLSRLLSITLFLQLIGFAVPAYAAIARDIEEKTGEARALLHAQPGDPAVAERIRALEDAIKRGEQASKQLWVDIERLESEKKALQAEVRNLERIQTVLTSGLIGALVTAAVAILGIFTTARRSRADRDLKRLEVLEKATELKSKGVGVPMDIQTAYEVAR